MPVLSEFRLPQMPNGPARDRLRSEQVSALARWSALLAFGSLLACLVIVVTFWRVAPHRFLLTILGILVAAHGVSVLGSRTWLRQARRDASARMVTIRIAVSFTIACVWATVPCTLMSLGTPEQRQLLVYVASGLISTSPLLAPLLPAAFAFASVTAVSLLLSTSNVDHTITVEHAILILLYYKMTCGVLLSQSSEFARRILSELTLEEQTDIIGLLLRDFEENASDWLWETDAALRLQRVSERLAQVVGCEREQLQGLSLLDLLRQDDALTGADEQASTKLAACLDSRLPFRDLLAPARFGGEEHWFCLTGRPVLDAAGVFRGYRGVGSDITAARRSDERIAYLARHDSLTELPNRVQFQDVLAEACAEPGCFALLCLDLDGFKTVNDTLGHGMGDALLIAVAGRLRTCLRDGDVVARLGGDEFAVLQFASDAGQAAALAQRLITRIGEPFQLGGFPTSIGLSVGIAMASGTERDPELLLKGADLALYHSKAEGRGTWHFFEAGMALRAQLRLAVQVELRHAITHDELSLDFQPIIDLASGQVIAAEALVRWQHPERGRIPPGDFIPVAEETGLIVELGAWVMRRACREAMNWAGTPRVAINLSPLQFRDPGLLALIDAALSESGLPPERLELEITESVFLDTVDATLACLQALRARGVHIALDDFGTGYSSLSYLRSFPFDKVKIDQSFIRDLSVNADAIAIVQAIVGMASSLGMRTTAEGVETQSQAELLLRTGCSQVQGFLFGRPCSPNAIATVMVETIAVAASALPASLLPAEALRGDQRTGEMLTTRQASPAL